MAVHQPLVQPLSDLAASYLPNRQDPGPISTAELTDKLSSIWESFSNSPELPDGLAKNPDVVRGVLELIGREFVVLAVINGQLPEPSEDASEEDKDTFQVALQDRLDIVLTLYEVAFTANQEIPSLEPGALFIPLMEELVELLSIATWRRLWSYIESRSERYTKGMLPSRGKSLPLLRTINAFLRFLPRTPSDLVFRGRIHQFASSVFSVADKSAINMRGDYGEVKTVWEEDEAAQEEIKVDEEVKEEETQEKGAEEKGDVVMDDAENKEATPQPLTPIAPPEPDFYSTLWSLQQYFAHPPSLDGPPVGSPPQTPFQTFRHKSNIVLPKLFEETQKDKDLSGKDEPVGKKRKRGDGGFFHPRYLTGKRLFSYELLDPSFRLQVLVQYCVLFQFLLNLTPAHAGKQAFTGGMPRSFVLEKNDEQWVKDKIGAIREEMKRMPDGADFEDTVFTIMRQEAHYASWKNDGCPEGAFEIPPLDPSASAKSASEAWSRRLNAPYPYSFKVGSRSLSMLWNNGFKSIDQLKGKSPATTVEGLDEQIRKLEEDEEDDKAMGQVDPEKLAANKESKTTANWRALRLASQTSLKHFPALKQNRSIHLLLETIKQSQEPKIQPPKDGEGEKNEGKEKKGVDDEGQEAGGVNNEGEAKGEEEGGEEHEDSKELKGEVVPENGGEVKADPLVGEKEAGEDKPEDPQKTVEPAVPAAQEEKQAEDQTEESEAQGEDQTGLDVKDEIPQNGDVEMGQA
ncbi:hypothetical protein IAR50_007446 [Cryptococcus sp. DSM 104548]